MTIEHQTFLSIVFGHIKVAEPLPVLCAKVVDEFSSSNSALRFPDKERADWYEQTYRKGCQVCAKRFEQEQRAAQDERIRQMIREEITRMRPSA